MINRRAFVTGMGAVLAAARAVEAQQAGRLPTIGVLSWGATTSERQLLGEALHDVGYIDGKNVAVEWRSAAGQRELAARYATELVARPVDVVVAIATPAAHAARDATQQIPIVIVAADPVHSGLVQSLSHPGGNITGISINLPAVAGKRLELLREAIPYIASVAFLASNTDPATGLFVRETERAGARLGVRVDVVPVRGPEEFDGAFETIARHAAGGLIVQPLFTRHSVQIVELAMKYRLPSISDLREFADAGGLMSYGPNMSAYFRRVAALVKRVLSGMKPADLPIEEPTTFTFAINLKTAKALGLTIPPSLLLRADQVIE